MALLRNVRTEAQCTLFIVSMKADLQDRQVVNESEGKELAQDLGAEFVQISVKPPAKNVKSTFSQLADLLHQRYEKGEGCSNCASFAGFSNRNDPLPF